MTASNSQSGTIEQQISLLEKLAESLANAQRALLQSDISAVTENTTLQTSICEQLLVLRKTWDPNGTKQRNLYGELAQKLTELEQRVRHANGVYGALLRRAARSVQITQNLYQTALGTYHPLDSAAPGISPEGI